MGREATAFCLLLIGLYSKRKSKSKKEALPPPPLPPPPKKKKKILLCEQAENMTVYLSP